jgi:hypothetical protein
MSDTMTATDSNGDKERTITLTARAVGPGDVWRSKEEVAQKERESRQFWADIPDTNRQAILVLVRDALLRLIEDPDVWVPTSVEPKSGNRLDVFVSIHLAEVDEEVLRRRVETERMIAETTTDLVKLRGELTDEERARLEAEEGRS